MQSRSPGITLGSFTPDFDLAIDPAAMAAVLANRLARSCSGSPEEEAADAVDLLILYAELAGRSDPAAVSARRSVEQSAREISVPTAVYDAVFGQANVLSTVGAGAGAAYAAASRRRVIDLVELTPDVRRKLISWGSRPGVGIKSARRNFPGVPIKRVNGEWVFELQRKPTPVYRVTGQAEAGRMAQIRIGHGQTIRDLSQTAPLSMAGMQQTRVGGVLTHGGVGAGLALGPQAVFDAIDAGGLNREFLRKQAYSQPANVAGLLAGQFLGPAAVFVVRTAILGTAAAVSAPAVAVIVASFGVGVAAQVLFGAIPIAPLGGRTASELVGDLLTNRSR